MKTHVTLTLNRADLITSKMIQYLLFGLFMVATVAFNSMSAQTQSTSNTEITVKGIVSDDKGPLPGVNIVLKGSKIGAITDENGAFTFPKELSSGDVLIFSFLGYEKQEIKIDTSTTFINLILSTDLVEIMGAPNTDKPYKSKRKN
ncbi:carboxypeptidase-like regulatory domain-containing protein [Psychroserpens sp.]